ncbi:MAG TPA: glycosyltransferase [Stellaceae bacterium]|nr:glycosyltransferase [Stellaceae bacterium]
MREAFYGGMGAWWLVVVLTFLGSTIMTLIQTRRRWVAPKGDMPAVSILVPITGIDPELVDNLRSILVQDYPSFELLVSFAHDDEAAIPLVRALFAEHPQVSTRLVVGEVKLGKNPKANNLIRSYRAARNDYVLMCDANVALPADGVRRMIAAFKPGVGLVSAIPVAVRPENFLGDVECAMFNGYAARWLCAGAMLGIQIAIGKILFVRKSDLDRAGGIEATSHNICEDTAMAHAMYSLSLRLANAGAIVSCPMGRRSFRDFWSRHVRWCRCRRGSTVPVGFIEPFLGMLAALLSGVAYWHGLRDVPVVGVVAGTLLGWVSVEAFLFYAQGWPLTRRSVPAWLAWEILLPVVWLRSLIGRTVSWRDTRMYVKAS